jgi:putative oxidoreductase
LRRLTEYNKKINKMKTKNITSWILRIIAAVILLQTLYFKFSGHPESVELFNKLGVEPWGRIGTGLIELITSILLLIPSTAFIGAFIGVGLMVGAILSHLTIIGIESKGDGGQLFILAIIVLVICSIIMLLNKQKGIAHLEYFIKKRMKTKSISLITLFSAVILLASCQKKNFAPTTSLNESVDTSFVSIHSGNFSSSSDKTVIGTAEIYKMGENHQVKLSNFSSDNGPALHVFLSKEAIPKNAIDLGALKSTMGTQVYNITGSPDFSTYKYISIHCVQYNHYFGSATLN